MHQRGDFLTINYAENNNENWLKGESAAAFLGASLTYNEETGLKIQVNQLSNEDGSHSGQNYAADGGTDTMVDTKYASKLGNSEPWNQALFTTSNNFDESTSKKMVDAFEKFGYKETLTLKNGKPAIEGTRAVKNHHHHIHFQGFSNKNITTMSKSDYGRMLHIRSRNWIEH